MENNEIFKDIKDISLEWKRYPSKLEEYKYVNIDYLSLYPTMDSIIIEEEKKKDFAKIREEYEYLRN